MAAFEYVSAIPDLELRVMAAYFWGVSSLIAFVIYITLDGLDLGLGMVVRARTRVSSQEMQALTVRPEWSGGEVWLVLAGVAALVAVPGACASFVSNAPVPALILVAALLLRGASVALTRHDPVARAGGWLYSASSWIVSFMIGFLGGMVLQIEPLLGAPVNWTDPFPWLSGLGMCWLHGLLGSAWLAIRWEQRSRLTRSVRAQLLLMPIWLIGAIFLASAGVKPSAWVAVLAVTVTAGMASVLRQAFAKEEGVREFLCVLALVGATGIFWATLLGKGLSHRDALDWIRMTTPGGGASFNFYAFLIFVPIAFGYVVWGVIVFCDRIATGAWIRSVE